MTLTHALWAYYAIGAFFVARGAWNGHIAQTWRELSRAVPVHVNIAAHLATALYLITLWPWPLWLHLRGER